MSLSHLLCFLACAATLAACSVQGTTCTPADTGSAPALSFDAGSCSVGCVAPQLGCISDVRNMNVSIGNDLAAGLDCGAGGALCQDCRTGCTGNLCIATTGGGRCGCQSDADCPADTTCDPATATCR